MTCSSAGTAFLVLQDSLPCRLYSQEKIRENLECEIMHVVVEEARDSYRFVQFTFSGDLILQDWTLLGTFQIIFVCHIITQSSILWYQDKDEQRSTGLKMHLSDREEVVQVLASNTVEDMDSNVERIVQWVKLVTGKS